MKHFAPLLLLIFLSCSKSDDAPIEKSFQCPQILEVPKTAIGTVENPFQGDILIRSKYLKQAGVTTSLWEGKVIPFYLDPRWRKKAPEDLKIIFEVMSGYEELGFTFPEIHPDSLFNHSYDGYIFIKYSGIAVSAIGKLGGEQEMYLPAGRNSFRKNTVHEFGHAVGLHHPHVTDMQEEWLTIYWDNILPEHKDFFLTYNEYGEDYRGQKEGYEYGDKYDIYSVMTYPSNAFGIDLTKPTMTLKDGTWFEPGDVLSEGDKQSILRMYECFKSRK